LRYKGMLGFGDVVLEGSSFASIGNPAAHHRLLCWCKRQVYRMLGLASA
jgi:hypothetical protein